MRAVEIDDCDYPAISNDWYHQFRAAVCITGDMARELVYVWHDVRPAIRGRRPAYALTKGDAKARWLAHERTEDQFTIDHTVKACPIHVGKELPKKRRSIGHISNWVGFAVGDCVYRSDKIGIEYGFGGTGGWRELVHDRMPSNARRHCRKMRIALDTIS